MFVIINAGALFPQPITEYRLLRTRIVKLGARYRDSTPPAPNRREPAGSAAQATSITEETGRGRRSQAEERERERWRPCPECEGRTQTVVASARARRRGSVAASHRSAPDSASRSDGREEGAWSWQTVRARQARQERADAVRALLAADAGQRTLLPESGRESEERNGTGPGPGTSLEGECRSGGEGRIARANAADPAPDAITSGSSVRRRGSGPNENERAERESTWCRTSARRLVWGPAVRPPRPEENGRTTRPCRRLPESLRDEAENDEREP